MRNPPAIVISGAGMATCLGLTREETWRRVQASESGMGPMSAMEQTLPPGRDGGQAPELPADFEPHKPREVRYLRRVILDAMAEAQLLGTKAYPTDRCAAVFGTTLHGMRSAGRFFRNTDAGELREFLTTSVLNAATAGLGLEGLATTTCSACSSSLGAIALAVTLLQSGQFDLVVAGGYDPISEYVYGGFNSLRLVAEGPLRPFSKDRQGMKLAEGYAAVVLERADDADRRGADAIVQVLGFGESADGHHLTQPHPQGDGAVRAMCAAMESAGVNADEIDLVAAHATGTPDNDAGEYAALRRVFAERLPQLPVVGFKSHLGHTLGGAGAVELILSAMALRDQIIPGCANVRADEIEFEGLNLAIGAAKKGRIRATLNTSLGFGGANTCVILGNAKEHTHKEMENSSPPSSVSVRIPSVAHSFNREVSIIGIGVVLPGAIGNEAFIQRIFGGSARITEDVVGVADDEIAHLLNARRVRRMSPYVKLTLASAAVAFADAAVTDIPAFSQSCSAILGTVHGSTNYSAEYYAQIVREGVLAANPMLFAEGVPNSGAAHLSMMMSLKGACQTIIGARTAGLDALHLAASRIADGTWDRAVVSAGEEHCPIVNGAYRHCGLYAGTNAAQPFHSGGFAVGAGAVTLILESETSIRSRGAAGHVRGKVQACASATAASGKEHVAAAERVLKKLGDVRHIISSANGTWVDRAELAAMKAATRDLAVSSMTGHVAEMFSAGALAGIAAVLLGGRLPPLFGQEALGGNLRRATGAERPDVFGVLASDFSGLVSGTRIGYVERVAD